ncbi:MAG: hypothetical protein ACKPKO_12285 [Candidatus Fonsibacter sp.]
MTTFFELKLCVIVIDDVAENEAVTVFTSATVIFVKLLPSPEKEPV